MKNDNLTYKGYTGVVGFETNRDGSLFYGKIIGIHDVLGFEGETVTQLIEDFQQTVDDYLEFCEEKGIKPQKPYSGTFNLRIPSDLHKQISLEAEKCGESMNAWVAEAIELRLKSEINYS